MFVNLIANKDIMVSVQGIRRLTLLNPSTAFHDSISPGISVGKFPRVVLDQPRHAHDANKYLRKIIEKERAIKRFGKLGVSQTRPHGIPDLIDCEYVSLSSLGDEIEKAISSRSDQLQLFLEQASERLKKDVDLIEINELIGIVSKMAENHFYDLKLMNSVKNEVLYDISRVHAPALAAIFNAFASLNIISPKLLHAGLNRMNDLVADVGDAPDTITVSVAIILRSLEKVPSRIIAKHFTIIQNSIEKLNPNQLTFPELTSLIKVLILVSKRAKLERTFNVSNLTDTLLEMNPTDIQSTADALYICATLGTVSSSEFLSRLNEFSITNASEIIHACNKEPGSIGNIEERNRAVNIAADMFISGKQLSLPLVEVYSPAFSESSVKGLYCRHLISIAKFIDQPFTRAELRRKINSFSENQKTSLV